MWPLVVIATVTASLTVASDGEPVRIRVSKPRGTVYWGGAGLNGPYIADQLQAFHEVGIHYIGIGKKSYGQYVDAGLAGTALRFEGRSDDRSWMIEGMDQIPSDQFNLIGYSYGSLMAAHTAHIYAANGYVVDHLVLIASTIDADFLKKLQSMPNIRKIIIINLQKYGDPIYAGMSQIEAIEAAKTVIKQDGESGDYLGIGHFYYRPNSEDGRKRRRALATYLFQQGLR